MPSIEVVIDARKAKTGGREAERAIDGVKDSSKKARDEMGRFVKQQDSAAKSTRSLTTAMTGLAGGLVLLSQARRSVRNIAELDTATVNLGKVSNLAGKELDNLVDSLGDLSRELPGTQIQMIDTAAAAARLGVSGAADIEKFTAVIARFGAATGGLVAGDNAATLLSRILNVTGEGVEKAEELAGAIALLGDNIAADEAEITDFTTNVAQATALFEPGSVKAAAFGATLASLGVRAELSGSAVGRLYRSLDAGVRDEGGPALELLTKLTGASADEFARLFRSDPTQAVQLFLSGLNQFIEAGGDSVSVLAKLGLSGEEVLKVVPTLAKNHEQLAAALDLVSDKSVNVEKLYEEVARSSTTLSASQERLRDTATAARKAFEERAKPYLIDVNNAATRSIELMFGLEKANTEAEKTFVSVSRAAAAVAGSMAAVAAVNLAGSLLSSSAAANLLSLRFTRQLIPSLGGVKAAGASSMTPLLVGMTAVTGFELGRYFFDEFKIVQTSSAQALKWIDDFADKSIAAFRGIFEYVRPLWTDLTDFMIKQMKAVATGLSVVLRAAGNDSLAATVDDWVLSAKTTVEKQFAAGGAFAAAVNRGRSSVLNNEIQSQLNDVISSNPSFTLGDNGPVLNSSANEIAAFAMKVRDFEDALKGQAISSELRDIRDALREYADAVSTSMPLNDRLDAVNDDLERALKRNEDVLKATIDSIDSEFGDRSRKGQSPLDFVARDILAMTEMMIGATGPIDTAAASLESFDSAAQDTASSAAQATADVAGINDMLGDTADKADRARNGIVDMVEQLNIEAALIRNGLGSEARERSIELLRIQSELLGMSGDELEKVVNSLNSSPMSLEDLVGDPGKLEDITTVMGHVEARLAAVREANDFEELANGMGNAFGGAFEDILFGTASIEEAITDMVANVSRLIFEQLVSQEFASIFAGGGGILGSLFGAGGTPATVPSAYGNVFDNGRITPFATGGVLSSPARFPMSDGGIGLAGEGGKEGVLPLKTDSQGRLGVIASGGSGGPTINMKVYANDADSFQRNSRQIARRAQRVMRRR